MNTKTPFLQMAKTISPWPFVKMVFLNMCGNFFRNKGAFFIPLYFLSLQEKPCG